MGRCIVDEWLVGEGGLTCGVDPVIEILLDVVV